MHMFRLSIPSSTVCKAFVITQAQHGFKPETAEAFLEPGLAGCRLRLGKHDGSRIPEEQDLSWVEDGVLLIT